MGVIVCPKCGTTTQYDGAPPVECRKCGVIYAKAEAAATRPPSSRGLRERLPFVETLRSQTNYPTFRSATRLLTFLFYAGAVIFCLGGLIGAFSSGGIPALLVGTLAGLFMAVLGRLCLEASAMLADLSDAAVYLAQQQATGRAARD